jgi:hypothetical protein
MGTEILSQDEIDSLIERTKDYDPAISFRITSMVTPEMVSTVKTMLKRYYFSLTHGDQKEQQFAKENLRKAAFKVWLLRNGFTDKFDYVRFINNEVKKRGLPWKLNTW